MEQSQQETSGMCVCACSTVWLYPRDLWYPNLGFSLCLEAEMKKKTKKKHKNDTANILDESVKSCSKSLIRERHG